MPFVRLKGSNHAHGRIYIALGANQIYGRQTPLENLREAINLLANAEIAILSCSRPWRTPAWPDPSDPPFINAAMEIATSADPAALLAILHGVEASLGRQRTTPNAPRTLDLDLIDYRGMCQSGEQGGPILPHPRASGRSFVLLPMRDIAPHWRDPVSGRSLHQLLAALPLADRRSCRPAGGSLTAAR